ncbi:MAG: hypothetical protein ACPGSD_17340 [Flavobacteriales bacterium]
MIKKTLIFIGISFLFNLNSYSQIGIGTTNPNESSIVDINSNSKGLLIPRLTELEKSLIESPANGLLIFNTSINCLQVNSGLPEFPYWAPCQKLGKMSTSGF